MQGSAEFVFTHAKNALFHACSTLPKSHTFGFHQTRGKRTGSQCDIKQEQPHNVVRAVGINGIKSGYTLSVNGLESDQSGGCTVSESEVEVELLVVQELVGGGVHGEDPE